MLNWDIILYIRKGEEDKNSIVTRTEKRTCSHFSCSVGEVARSELQELGFDNQEKNRVVSKLSSLTKFVKKGFEITLRNKSGINSVEISMHTPESAYQIISSFDMPEEYGITEVLKQAENWASCFIQKFNSDQENTL